MSKKKIKVFEGFAGYGGGSFAFKRLHEIDERYNFEVVGYSEIDNSAKALYDLNHKDIKGNPIKNYGDITKINPDEIPDFDMFVGGFPCQPFSNAGMQKGVDDPYGRGTLFQHIMRICDAKKPKYILLENVKGFLSKKFEPTRLLMEDMLRQMGYVSNPNDSNESPLRIAVLNSKDYGIPQNRERVWMFARLGGLPKDFSIVPEKRINNKKLCDFLDPKKYIPENMYLSDDQVAHLKEKHKVDSFKVKKALCFDVYNHKIKTDGYCITITMPEHNGIRVIEPNKSKEVVRKLTVTEQFRLMGLEGLDDGKRKIDIVFGNQKYTQLSKRAGNGWDVNVVTILLEHIINQLNNAGDKIFK